MHELRKDSVWQNDFRVDYWVGRTKAWEIPDTEDLKPYINTKDKVGKWFVGTVGFAIVSAILSEVMNLLVK